MSDDKTTIIQPLEVFPDGKGGFTACPSVMTEEEVIRYLRLDITSDNPKRTLKHWRDKHLLHGIRLSRVLVYPRFELEAFIKRITEK